MDPTRIHTNAAPAAVGPYSQAMVAPDGLVYTAGQIAIDPTTSTFRSDLDVAGQARLLLSNLRAILEAAGSSMDRVVKTTVYLASMSDFAAMNAVYAEAFGDHKPARSTVGVAELPLGARVEIEAIAVLRPRP